LKSKVYSSWFFSRALRCSFCHGNLDHNINLI